jgi:hypothetical protein
LNGSKNLWESPERPLASANALGERPANAFLLFSRKNPFNLSNVVEVVAGKHADDVFNGFLAPLGV